MVLRVRRRKPVALAAVAPLVMVRGGGPSDGLGPRREA